MSDIAQGSANGPKNIFGRKNVNWQGPQRAGGKGINGGPSSVAGDFSQSQDDQEYKDQIRQAFVDDLGGEAVKDHIVSNAVLSEVSSTGLTYTKKDLDSIKEKYEKYYDDFSSTDSGSKKIENNLSTAAHSGYDLVSDYDPDDNEFNVNDDEISSFASQGGFKDSVTSLKNYVSMREGEKDNKEAFESLVEKEDENNSDDDIYNVVKYAQENKDDIGKEIEKLKVQDAHDRGYDSVEEYEWDLEDARDEYASDRGFDKVKEEAVSTAVESYLKQSNKDLDDRETRKLQQHFSHVFDKYYEEGFNSEIVLDTALSANSSFEVVDVRDGDMEVDEEQEDKWAKSSELDHVKDDFSHYAKGHPYKG